MTFHRTQNSDATRLPSPSQEARTYRRLRATILKTIFCELCASARLRLALALLMSLGIWISLFFIMHEGFSFLEREAGAFTQETVEKVFNIFYASLMIMLFFSSTIIFYGGMYRSQEVAFLITTPTSPSRIFNYKFLEAVVLSSWGFVLIGSPMMIAYGVVVGAPWYYYLLLPPMIIAFVYIPTCLGAIACLLVVHWLSRFRRPVVALMGFSIFACGLWLLWTIFLRQQNELLTPEWFEETMIRLSATENRLLPSWWLCSGLLEAARHGGTSLDYQPWAQALLFLSLLVSNALALQMVATWIADTFFLTSYSRLQTEHGNPRIAKVQWIDHLLPGMLPFVSAPIRILLAKDIRTVRRDPLQWAQFLIFFGLVGLYFLNIQSIQDATPFAGWLNLVSFLNLLVVGLILSTFTTRFVFPMISLEGQRFWILGLLPIERDTILWGKFLFSAIVTGIPSSLLILLSDALLQIPPVIIFIHELACLLLCTGLAAIAVGLGACMPDLRATSPSKIAAGFGGTLNLILSALYIIVIVGLTAAPSHLHAITQLGELSDTLDPNSTRIWMAIGVGAAVVIGVGTTTISLRRGFRAFSKMEFS